MLTYSRYDRLGLQNAAGANYADYLIGVQSVVIDPLDRLW